MDHLDCGPQVENAGSFTRGDLADAVADNDRGMQAALA